MSDMEQLAARLVEAATEALHEPAAIEDFAESLKQAARAAAVAVLREMEKDVAADLETAHEAAQATRIETHKHSHLGERSAYYRIAEKYRGLADYIEKGAADDRH